MSGSKKVKKGPIIVFALGIILLIAGIITLVIRLISAPVVTDAEFLISGGEWVREDEPTVIWNFKEVGKGSLTTDEHLNDYDFIWAIEDGKLKIETDWLYDLEDDFDYTIDQGAKTLTIKNDAVEVTFKAQEKSSEQ